MKKNNPKNRKQRTGVVYSTDPEFQYSYNDDPSEEIYLPPEQQTLYIAIDRKGRKGKTVTLISGFTGTSEDRKALARLLKSACNTGGSVKGDEILIQGDFRDSIIQLLTKAGYNTKRKGG